MELFADGETDAFLGFPPEPQELRARGIDRVILSTVSDRPWSQYFCCMIYGNRAWVREHPVATKRFLRAVFKAAEFCAGRPASTPRDGWSMAGSRRSTTTRSRRSASCPTNCWHEYDSGGLPALLRAAPARGGHAAHQPERAARRRHRLALRQRAQARAEGVRRRRRIGLPAASGTEKEASDADHPKSPRIPGQRCRWPRPRACSALGRSLADEAPPETTTIRLAEDLPASALRRSTSPRSCCAPKASPMSAMCAVQAGVETSQKIGARRDRFQH